MAMMVFVAKDAVLRKGFRDHGARAVRKSKEIEVEVFRCMMLRFSFS